jgi:TPR repeat protein
MYENGGDGVPIDMKAAFESYKKAADLGSNSAMFALGRMYDDGLGTAVNKNAALQWYLRASDLGYKGAAYRIAFAYDRLYSSDLAAESILKALSEGDEVIISRLKSMSPFTLRALKQSLHQRGLFSGPITDEITPATTKALEDYYKANAS